MVDTIIKIPIDPAKKKVAHNVDFFAEYEHMQWCERNCRSDWWNECNDYSYICVTSNRDALAFGMRWGLFQNEQEKMWFMLRYS